MAALLIIPILTFLIFVHELGHYVMAKRAGVKVEEFGFGLPPRLYGIQRGETIWSINWIPLGGFVRVLGEDGKDFSGRSMQSKTPGQRASFLAAGSSHELPHGVGPHRRSDSRPGQDIIIGLHHRRS